MQECEECLGSPLQQIAPYPALKQAKVTGPFTQQQASLPASCAAGNVGEVSALCLEHGMAQAQVSV